MQEVRTGSCLCGAVGYKVTGKLRGVVYCHCTQCRKQSGHFFAATNVPDRDLRIDGADNLTWFEASAFARRGFCSICGSILFWKHNELDEISILAGSFDSPSGLKAEGHIFVADKGDYYEITDGLPENPQSSPTVRVAGS